MSLPTDPDDAAAAAAAAAAAVTESYRRWGRVHELVLAFNRAAADDTLAAKITDAYRSGHP